MAETETFAHAVSRALRERALAFPETTEGTACVNRAFKVRGKNFAFVGETETNVRVMVKLKASREAAAAMGDPRVSVGNIGWVTVNFPPEDPLDEALLGQWIEESFRALAPKSVVKKLDA